MADLNHIKWLCSGTAAWNERRVNSDFAPDLTHIDMRRVDLRSAQLQDTDFDGSRLTNVDLANAMVSGARLNGIVANDSRFDGANCARPSSKVRIWFAYPFAGP